ncbi:MAG TPA: CBS domain-containing protein [Bryobacteraceae bacterium]|nr:CBS domain-containing protein [Bryobacteraceae bacterium]
MELKETLASVLAGKRREVWWIPPQATVYEAIAVMAEKGVGALLVMSGDKLEGIISERDYARKVILLDKASRNTLVREIMSDTVYTVTPNHTISDCLQIMTERRIRHLPVLEDGRVAGIVTIGDLVKWLAGKQAETIEHLQAYIGGTYPG